MRSDVMLIHVLRATEASYLRPRLVALTGQAFVGQRQVVDLGQCLGEVHLEIDGELSQCCDETTATFVVAATTAAGAVRRRWCGAGGRVHNNAPEFVLCFFTLDVSVDPGGQIYLRFTPAVAGPAGCLALCDELFCSVFTFACMSRNEFTREE